MELKLDADLCGFCGQVDELGQTRCVVCDGAERKAFSSIAAGNRLAKPGFVSSGLEEEESSNKNQTQTFGQGDGAMNDLITAYETVCYEVNAVHYLNRSQGTHMVHLNHALLPHFPCMFSSVALRARLFFLGEDEKEVLQSFWKDQQTAETVKVPGLK
ncbi:unnamed protein product [Tetraodon nigroviridis]|uniref:(spotted green pufferfish) hypothetical protein n=1 Tax=Tetraodon nigroviridis TaxID=99883 RepID=Q4SJI8_TETNG|nr:unnamed protein product [Tetraodon nigroviridis]